MADSRVWPRNRSTRGGKTGRPAKQRLNADAPVLQEMFDRELSLARPVLTEDRRPHGRKIYSLHTPEVLLRGGLLKLRLRRQRLRCRPKR